MINSVATHVAIHGKVAKPKRRHIIAEADASVNAEVGALVIPAKRGAAVGNRDKGSGVGNKDRGNGVVHKDVAAEAPHAQPTEFSSSAS